jgi:hypothetical protein
MFHTTLYNLQYIPGNINLIVTAPHGGKDKPDSILDRLPGCKDSAGNCRYDSSDDFCNPHKDCKIGTVADSRTMEVARIASDAIEGLVGRPHLVLMHVARYQTICASALVINSF